MQVIKVGGSVLNSVEGFEKLRSIIGSSNKDRKLIIISALSKTTRNLLEMAHQAAKGYFAKSQKSLNNIIHYHSEFAKKLIQDKHTNNNILIELEKDSNVILELLRSIALTKELPARVKDQILSYGEKFALLVAGNFLTYCGISHKLLDSSDIIMTDENYGSAKPLENETNARIIKKLIHIIENNRIVITQGFVARSKKGNITTMGVESSNLTAALYANHLNVAELTIWSDVPGIHTADPRIAENAELIGEISYDDAYDFGLAGLKLIYPGMIDYARANNIRLIFRSAFHPGNKSTVIKSKSKQNKILIVSKNNLKMFCFKNFDKFSELINQTDLFFCNGNEKIFLTDKEFPAKNGKEQFSQHPDVSIVTIFNASSESIINALNKYDQGDKNIILFAAFTGCKSIIVVEKKYSDLLIKFMHKKLIG